MSYAGDLTPQDAWAKLEAGAILVDVRTEGEWAHIGIPDTKATENDPLFIQWNLAGGIPNSRFIEDLRQQAPETTAWNWSSCAAPASAPSPRPLQQRRQASPHTTSSRALKVNPTATASAP